MVSSKIGVFLETDFSVGFPGLVAALKMPIYLHLHVKILHGTQCHLSQTSKQSRKMANFAAGEEGERRKQW